MPDKKSLLLAFYCTGIIVGGGILALPLVSVDTGAIALISLLVILGIIFYLIYIRLIDAVSTALEGKTVFHMGLTLYDEGLRYSGIIRYGGLAFTVGLALYTLPADLVYVLYGMKSLLELAKFASLNETQALLGVGSIIIIGSLITFYSHARKEIYTGVTSLDLILKLSLMVGAWIITIGIIRLFSVSAYQIIIASSAFSISLIIGEYYPEKFFKNRVNLALNNEILPRHRVSSYLTIFKLSLILGTPLIALIIIINNASLSSSFIILPRSPEALIAATSIIIFMYVGSGIYNILIYDWITKDWSIGREIVLLAVIISMITYIAFTMLILISVDPNILIKSSIDREHAFISLSRKLESVGLGFIGLIVIIVANIFALVSVSIAYMGFTDTLSDRLNIDINLNRDATWILITILTLISVVLLEIFDVSKIATDALGIAGNAGGGLFLLILPWLMKDSSGKRRIDIAIIFTIIITVLNLFIIKESYSIVAKIIGVISTILVIVFATLVIKEVMQKRD